MDLLYFIRLFKRNIILLIGVPFLLFVVVYYFTRTREKTYQSEEVIYTGITTGYSIESTSRRPSNFFTNSAQYDNLINLLKSRKTEVETSLMLFAQDLSLKHYNPQYISNENFDRLQEMIPKRIKDLVVVNNKSGIEREKAGQIRNQRKEIHSLGKQIGKKRNQVAKGRTALTGYDQPGYSNSSNSGPGKNDSGANSSNNNFISQSVLSSDGSKGIFIKDPIVPPGVNSSDFQKTVNNIRRYYASSDTNYIYGLLHYGQSKHYSTKYINKIQVLRISNSDLVRLTFTSNDPGICQQTLRIMTKVFMEDYKSLRVNETGRVVQYFQHQVDSSKRRLSDAEDRLLHFNERNNIINYYEQSKAIAQQKEVLNTYFQEQQIRLSGASLTLRELETKMTSRDSIYLKSDIINQKKKQLADISEKIIVNKLAQNYNNEVAARLKVLTKQQQKLRNDIKLYVDQLYLYGHSTQGLPLKSLMEAWLKNTIVYTEAKAALIVLARRKLNFIRTYQKMAPLGAMLTRIQRGITISEQTYLELLKSLNTAKMNQQNLEMSSKMKVVDPPFFPLTPNPSRAKYIVIASGMAGFIIVMLIIIMLDYYDTSIRSPSRAVEQTGFSLAGAYPYLSSKHLANELSKISSRLIDMIIQQIKLNTAKSQPEKPYLALIFSTQDEVGKSLISKKIIDRMRSMGDKVLFLNYKVENTYDEEEDFNYAFHYTVKNNFIDVKNLQELVDSRYLRKDNVPYDYIFLEIPSIVHHTYPIKLLSEIDLALFILKSSSSYSRADKTAIKSFLEAASNEPLVILNEVELFNLGELLSDIPKSRVGRRNKLKAMFSYAAQYKIVIKKKEVKNRG